MLNPRAQTDPQMILSDPTLSLTKIQYNNMGPSAIYTVKDEGR